MALENLAYDLRTDLFFTEVDFLTAEATDMLADVISAASSSAAAMTCQA